MGEWRTKDGEIIHPYGTDLYAGVAVHGGDVTPGDIEIFEWTGGRDDLTGCTPDEATSAMQLIVGMAGTWDARRQALRQALQIIDLLEGASGQSPEAPPVSD